LYRCKNWNEVLVALNFVTRHLTVFRFIDTLSSLITEDGTSSPCCGARIPKSEGRCAKLLWSRQTEQSTSKTSRRSCDEDFGMVEGTESPLRSVQA
jgi:hypothetical protein